jgi:hypothetical protein
VLTKEGMRYTIVNVNRETTDDDEKIVSCIYKSNDSKRGCVSYKIAKLLTWGVD